MDRELRYHVDRRVSDLILSGLPEPEARRQAMLELGGLTQVREEVSDVCLSRWRSTMDPLFQAPDPALVQGASVTFEPGARTAWHTHPPVPQRRRELDQIQFLLGHVSVQTTGKYLGCKQRLQNAVNDRIGTLERYTSR